jgi:HEAT repeat protein
LLLLLFSSGPGNCQSTSFTLESLKEDLSSRDEEKRREAVLRLIWIKSPQASEIAERALNDRSAKVRAVAAKAILQLPQERVVQLLLPLLKDKNEFVRREAAYAAGALKSPLLIPALAQLLRKDRSPAVRGAAALSLGEIEDQSSVEHLIVSLNRRREDDEFVRRSSARSLGLLKSVDSVPALTSVLMDKKESNDVRREAAQALGIIGDKGAIDALRSVLDEPDPYLSRIAYEALRNIDPASAKKPL